jgi:hypothetical protein
MRFRECRMLALERAAGEDVEDTVPQAEPSVLAYYFDDVNTRV